MDIFDVCYALMKEQVHKERKINENSDSFFIELTELVNSKNDYISLFAGQIIDLFLALYATYSETYHAIKNNKHNLYKKSILKEPQNDIIEAEPLLDPEENDDAFFEDEGFEDVAENVNLEAEAGGLLHQVIIDNQAIIDNDFDWGHMNV